jgi:hypothetical protein
MVCNARTKGMTVRHDLLLGAWRRIAHPAGVATAVEPAMERLQAGTGRASFEHSDMLVVLPDEGLVVTDVSVVHPAANSFFQRAARTAGATASLRDASKFRKYGGGGQVAGGSFTPLSMESYGRLGRPAMQLLQTLTAAAASSATAGSDVTTSSFVTGALRELGVALVKGNEVVYREALHVYATAGGTAARVGATVPTVDPEWFCFCCCVLCCSSRFMSLCVCSGSSVV